MHISGVWSVIKTPSLLFLLFCVFLVSLGATTIWNFYSTYLKDNGASDSLVGYGLSFQGLCELPIFYFSARIILRLGLKTTLVITVLATVIRMVLYYFINSPIATLPVELLHGFSWSLFWVVCVEYVNKLVDEHWLATGQSLLYAAYFGVGAIAGNYWTGLSHQPGKDGSGNIFTECRYCGSSCSQHSFVYEKENQLYRNRVMNSYLLIALTHQSTKFTTWSSTGA